MATFTALNIEYDKNIEVPEIDDTKELQVEEALKLYQTALKLHSEGSESYSEAAVAYTELFKSEIFAYPESQSALKRIELFGDAAEWDGSIVPQAGPTQSSGNEESAPNTLPQILHLSYKNHGMFVLDQEQAAIQQRLSSIAVKDQGTDTLRVAKSALMLFTEALDKDESDLDLWGSSAHVAILARSERIARYCLEAVLDDEDEGYKGVLALPGLEEGYALHQLRKELVAREDDLALRLPPLTRLFHKKSLADTYLRLVNPYKAVELPQSRGVSQRARQDRSSAELNLHSADMTWAAVGEVLLQQYRKEQKGDVPHVAGRVIKLDLRGMHEDADNKEASGVPPVNDDEETMQTSTPTTLNASGSPAAIKQESHTPILKTNSEDTAATPAVVETTTSDVSPRKRSSDSAGLQENEDDGVRLRSKRIKARESIVERSKEQDAVTQEQSLEATLSPILYVDGVLRDLLDGVAKSTGIDAFAGTGLPKHCIDPAEQSCNSEDTSEAFQLPLQDMRDLAMHCDLETVTVLLKPEATDRLQREAQESGIHAFTGHHTANNQDSDSADLELGADGLPEWTREKNESDLTIAELAKSWLLTLLNSAVVEDSTTTTKSSYMRHLWHKDMKRTVVQMLVHLDEHLYTELLSRAANIDDAILTDRCNGRLHGFTAAGQQMLEVVQAIYELHLDIYFRMRQPASGVTQETRSAERERLTKWAGLSRHVFALRASPEGEDPLDDLTVRHAWATTFQLAMSEDVAQDHVLLCLEQLKQILRHVDGPLIELKNNVVMPRLSIAALDAEIDRIRMKDFLAQVFEENETDPVTTIENLEPVLELPFEGSRKQVDDHANDEEMGISSHAAIDFGNTLSNDSSALHAVSNFLESANVWPRLHLWKRLREAYSKIDVPEKVVSCDFRCLELLMRDVASSNYSDLSKTQRKRTLLSYLRLADDLLVKILSKTQAVSGSTLYLDTLDSPQLESGLDAINKVLGLLQTFLQYEDIAKAGGTAAMPVEASTRSTFGRLAEKVHDVWVRVFMLQYAVLKVVMARETEKFRNSTEQQFNFLCAVHQCAAVREFCHASNKAFLRLCKSEFLDFFDRGQVGDLESFEWQLSIVLYDLYGLKCLNNAKEIVEMHCAKAGEDTLTKSTAARLLGFLLKQTSTISTKDLLKLDLRLTIERVHGSLGKPKSNEYLSENKRRINTFIRSTVHPLELYRCLDGLMPVVPRPASDHESPGPFAGWYFLMGDIARSKFLIQKQKSPQAPPIDDLQIATSFYTHSLEHDMNNWEAWYRLAQCYDFQLEESVLWTAEKINTSDQVLNILQRNAIHCYVMATAMSADLEEPTSEVVEEIAKLYADFGTRIYAASREPFSMAAFDLREEKTRFLSKLEVQQEPFESATHTPLTEYAAWKFAAALFRRANSRSVVDDWWSYYMLGKCLWKMYGAMPELRNRFRLPEKPNVRPQAQHVLDALGWAIDAIPSKREGKKEPILEPHYKLLSVVHKLVQRKDMTEAGGAEAIQASKILRKVSNKVEDDGWEGYMLALLKALKGVDKSGWHHRITARVVLVIYDEVKQLDKSNPSYQLGMMGARSEFMQSIFTKTMTVQVWKPEHERAGRHFLYMTRYTRLFVKVLEDLSDYENMEQLAKRVRKKTTEFFEHTKLWGELCLAYMRLLRSRVKVSEGYDDLVFKGVQFEHFVERADQLEAEARTRGEIGCCVQETLVLRDILELKKLNGTLMKPTLLDDLLCDAYAFVYSTHSQRHPGMRRDDLLASTGMYSTGGVNGGLAGQMSIVAVAQDAPGKARFKGVGRRELLKRAEALVVALNPIKGAVQTTLQVTPMRQSNVAVVIHASGTGVSAAQKQIDMVRDGDDSSLSDISVLEDMPTPDSVLDGDVEHGGMTGAEVEQATERETERPMFPNLRTQDDAMEETGVEEVAVEEEQADDAAEEDENEDEVVEEEPTARAASEPQVQDAGGASTEPLVPPNLPPRRRTFLGGSAGDVEARLPTHCRAQ